MNDYWLSYPCVASEQEFVPSWFQSFNKELVDAVSFSEHEAFDHPVACKFVSLYL